jgi:hypothetical protein
MLLVTKHKLNHFNTIINYSNIARKCMNFHEYTHSYIDIGLFVS